MTNAEKYFIELLKDKEFREHYLLEKMKLDIEYELDELVNKINTGKSKTTLIRGVNKIKRTLSFV